ARSRLARQVEDPVGAREVELVLGEVDARHVKARRVLLLERDVVVVGEAVERDDIVAALEQRLREVRADEARGAGDDVSHSRAGYPAQAARRSAAAFRAGPPGRRRIATLQIRAPWSRLAAKRASRTRFSTRKCVPFSACAFRSAAGPSARVSGTGFLG